jgi:hypothetical protein
MKSCRRLLVLVVIVFLTLLSPAEAAAQWIRGTVRVGEGGPVLPGAQVELRPARGVSLPALVTDSLGGFAGPVPLAGAVDVSVSHPGYRMVGPVRVVVGADEELVLVVRLETDAILLDPVEVTARRRIDIGTAVIRRRIEDMRQRRIGISATREELERMSRHNVGSVLTTLSTRIRLIDSQQANVNTILLRDGSSSGGYCAPAIFIDGFRANPRPTNVNFLIEPSSIEAIELYMGAAQVPIGYQDPLGCGSVLIWSRRGDAEEGRPHTLLRWAVAGALLAGILILLR